MSAPSLYTAKQAAIAIIAAAHRGKIDPVALADMSRGAGVSTAKVYAARRAVVQALARVNDRPPEAIGAALKFWTCERAARQSLERERLKMTGDETAIKRIAEAVRYSCKGDAATLAPYRPKKPEATPAGDPPVGDAAGAAGVASSTASAAPVRDAAAPGKKKRGPVNGNAHRRIKAVEAATGGELGQRDIADARDCAVEEDLAAIRRRQAEREAQAPAPSADYSKMTPQQIAEHEQCEALLRAADRSEGLYPGAARLAKDSFGGRRGARIGGAI
jgi:hypothetical protein